MWYTNVDDDVEAAPIYRCNGKAKQPARPCKNHDLHIEQESTEAADALIRSSCMQIIW